MDDNAETRKTVEYCYQKRRTTLNPIIDWEEDEVWEFLNDVAKVPHCSLYDEGFTRLGCIGCPLQGKAGMQRDFERWPRYKELYIRAFDKMIKNHPGEIRIATGEPAVENGGAARRRMAEIQFTRRNLGQLKKTKSLGSVGITGEESFEYWVNNKLRY